MNERINNGNNNSILHVWADFTFFFSCLFPATCIYSEAQPKPRTDVFHFVFRHITLYTTLNRRKQKPMRTHSLIRSLIHSLFPSPSCHAKENGETLHTQTRKALKGKLLALFGYGMSFSSLSIYLRHHAGIARAFWLNDTIVKEMNDGDRAGRGWPLSSDKTIYSIVCNVYPSSQPT